MRDLKSYSRRLQDESLAAQYAHRFEHGARRRIDRREQRAVQTVFNRLHDCQSVLDVPSGAGRFLPSLRGERRSIIGMDVSREILAHARERASQLGVRASFLQGDASSLPLRNGAVDVVFCNRLLHHIVLRPERMIILRELHRVARRHVVVSFFDYQSFATLRRLLKAFKGSKPKYDGQPNFQEFEQELGQCGLRVEFIVPTGPPWVSQKYLALKKIE